MNNINPTAIKEKNEHYISRFVWTAYFTEYKSTLDAIEPKDIQIRARQILF